MPRVLLASCMWYHLSFESVYLVVRLVERASLKQIIV